MVKQKYSDTKKNCQWKINGKKNNQLVKKEKDLIVHFDSAESCRAMSVKAWRFATVSTLFKSMATVTGPTPPGTGETYPATFRTDSKSTSPTIPPSDSEEPASIKTAPCLIILPVIYLPFPMPEIITSACCKSRSLFSVLLSIAR